MDKRRFLFQVFFIWITMWLFMAVFFRPAPPQEQPSQEIFAAIQAEERRVEELSTAQHTISDRIKQYQDVRKQYSNLRRNEKTSEIGINTLVGELRVLDRMLELESTNTGFYDQQEQLLKELEQKFKGRATTLIVDSDGRTLDVEDVSGWAEGRLTEVRRDRDEIFQDRWYYGILAFLVDLTGRAPAFSYWFALLLLTVVLKGLLWPVTRKQFQSMRDMQRVAPQLKALQEELRQKNRPPREQQERIMQFYREKGVSPFGGCLPMIVQMAVIIPVFIMIRQFEYQFSYGHFLWISPELGERFWWIGRNLASFDVPIFIIYMISMIAFSLLQPKATDPEQARMQRMMMIMLPGMFGVMMWIWKWSSAFMLYWLFQNLFSMWQNWGLLRQPPAAPAAATSSGGGGAPSAPLEPMRGQPGTNTNGRRSGRRSRSRGRGSRGSRR